MEKRQYGIKRKNQAETRALLRGLAAAFGSYAWKRDQTGRRDAGLTPEALAGTDDDGGENL